MADDPELATRRLKLKLTLEDLREMKGFGTELVTVVIPPDRQVSDARQMLQNEHGQAANIKSKSTKKNEVDAPLRIASRAQSKARSM